MARFVDGDIVVIPFPFTDLFNTKRRPALVVKNLNDGDLFLCQITSQLNKDNHAISLNISDFDSGSLRKPSNIRPNRIFTASNTIIQYKIGDLTSDKYDEVVDEIINILKKN